MRPAFLCCTACLARVTGSGGVQRPDAVPTARGSTLGLVVSGTVSGFPVYLEEAGGDSWALCGCGWTALPRRVAVVEEERFAALLRGSRTPPPGESGR